MMTPAWRKRNRHRYCVGFRQLQVRLACWRKTLNSPAVNPLKIAHFGVKSGHLLDSGFLLLGLLTASATQPLFKSP